jgi:hypothetical protein
MQKDNQITSWGAEDHPSVELLRQHEEGTLPSQVDHQLEKHLLDCELCTDVLQGIALTDRTRTRSNVYKISQRIKNRLRKQRKRTILHGLSDWRIVIAIFMVCCLIGLLLFFLYMRSLTSQQTPDASPELQNQPGQKEILN